MTETSASTEPHSAHEVQIFLRPIGTPLPLGFVGLAVATSVLSAFNLGWIPTIEQHQVALVLVAFAFPIQLVATVLLFLVRDAPSGAGLGVLSLTWLALGLLLVTGTPGTLSATASIFLFACAAALIPAVLSASISKLVPAAVLGMASLRFLLTGIWERLGGIAWQHAAGWEGIVLAGLALYAALASDLEGLLHHTLLPMGRHGRGRQTLVQDLRDQVPELEREPGVRSQV